MEEDWKWTASSRARITRFVVALKPSIAFALVYPNSPMTVHKTPKDPRIIQAFILFFLPRGHIAQSWSNFQLRDHIKLVKPCRFINSTLDFSTFVSRKSIFSAFETCLDGKGGKLKSNVNFIFSSNCYHLWSLLVLSLLAIFCQNGSHKDMLWIRQRKLSGILRIICQLVYSSAFLFALCSASRMTNARHLCNGSTAQIRPFSHDEQYYNIYCSSVLHYLTVVESQQAHIHEQFSPLVVWSLVLFHKSTNPLAILLC